VFANHHRYGAGAYGVNASATAYGVNTIGASAINAYCGKEACIGHCAACGLATEEEQAAVRLQRQREWAEDR